MPAAPAVADNQQPRGVISDAAFDALPVADQDRYSRVRKGGASSKTEFRVDLRQL
jgi:hypothetical protein